MWRNRKQLHSPPPVARPHWGLAHLPHRPCPGLRVSVGTGRGPGARLLLPGEASSLLCLLDGRMDRALEAFPGGKLRLGVSSVLPQMGNLRGSPRLSPPRRPGKPPGNLTAGGVCSSLPSECTRRSLCSLFGPCSLTPDSAGVQSPRLGFPAWLWGPISACDLPTLGCLISTRKTRDSQLDMNFTEFCFLLFIRFCLLI